MPAAVRLGDLSTGHPPWPPRPNNGASTDVLINNLGAHRVGDTWAIHCAGSSCHVSTQLTGSPNVFVNGRALARVGDDIACGDKNAQGSPNVFVNG